MIRRRALYKTQVPIMSFQTDFNGTFNPYITLLGSILIWEVDGVKQKTNNPSFELTGGLVDVNVYPNNAKKGVIATSVNFYSLNFIGALNLEYFTIIGDLVLNSNIGLTSITFSVYDNVIGTTRISECNLSSIDFTNVRINGETELNSNSNLSSITFGDFDNYSTTFEVNNCSLTSLDFSSFTNMISVMELLGNTNLGTFIQPQNATFSSFKLAPNTELLTLDLTNCHIGGYLGIANTNITQILFNNTVKSCQLDLYNNGFTSLDLSSFDTVIGRLRLQDNSNLVNLIAPIGFSTDMYQLSANGDALNIASIDGLLGNLNTYFSANTPTSDLILDLSNGTNASPTNGLNNADLLNLISIYQNTAYALIYSIN